MIKIKLTEARTLPVPENLVDQITRVYRAAYIKLVVDFINNKLDSDIDTRLRDKYDEVLEHVQTKYSKELADAESGSVGFISDLDIDSVIQNGEIIESIPVEQFIMALLSWPELQTYVRGRIKPASLKTRLKSYFKNKGVDDIQFIIDFGTRGTTLKKDYAGLYKSDVDEIHITFNASYFLPEEDEYSERNTSSRILSIKNVETELEDTRISIRHELQHLFQNVMSTVLKTGDWNIGLPPRDVVAGAVSDEEEHYMIPIEMQTDIQDEVDKFVSSINAFKEKNAKLSAIFPQAIKILAKLFTDSNLTSDEQSFAKKYRLNTYVISNDLFRDIKSKDKSGKLYKYAMQILYAAIKKDMPSLDKLTIPLSQRYDRKNKKLKEDIIMDKIKVVLKESNLINEQLSKEELRKIIRDEFEKLLKDKDSKKKLPK